MLKGLQRTSREQFEAQFEAVPGGVHYRPGGVGKPLLLTEAEWVDAVAAFKLALPRWSKALAAALVLLIAGQMVIIRSPEPVALITLAAMWVIACAMLWWSHRLQRAPARAYAGRTADGGRRSADAHGRLGSVAAQAALVAARFGARFRAAAERLDPLVQLAGV